MRQLLRQSSWVQRLVQVVLGINALLILVGPFIVPSTLRTTAGVVSLVGACCMQIGLAALVCFGPWSMPRLRQQLTFCFVCGMVFALIYLGIVVVEFLGVQDNINIVLLFVGIGCIAGAVAGYRSSRWSQGLLAAIWALVIGAALWSVGMLLINYVAWGSHQQYVFWLYDGAIDDFHRSGSTDLNAFLLQDLQGAVFYHPLLSIVFGALCGAISSAVAQAVLWLQRIMGNRSRVRPTTPPA